MSDFKNFVEHVVNVPLAVAATSVTQTSNLPAGQVIAVAAFFDDSRFNDIVRVSIKDFSGFEVSKMQDIRNLRDREAAYLQGKKPLYLEGGQNISITLQTATAISVASSVDFVFVYAN